MKEMCINPNLEHKVEFVIAAFGYQCWQCIICGLLFDEIEDSSG